MEEYEGTGMKRYRDIKLDSDVNAEDEISFDDFDDFAETDLVDVVEEGSDEE